jgi:hypothetical protein
LPLWKKFILYIIIEFNFFGEKIMADDIYTTVVRIPEKSIYTTVLQIDNAWGWDISIHDGRVNYIREFYLHNSPANRQRRMRICKKKIFCLSRSCWLASSLFQIWANSL